MARRPPSELFIASMHLDTIGGPGAYEHKYRAFAQERHNDSFDSWLEEPAVGYVDYTVVDGRKKIYLDWIFVDEKHRRQGVATAMLDAISKEHGEHPFVWGMTSPEGDALYQVYQQRKR